MSPTFSEEGREEELQMEFNHVVNDSINHVYVMKPW